MDNDRLTKRVFNHDLALCRNNWSSDVKDIMNKLGVTDAFNPRSTVNMTDVNVRIYNHYSMKWCQDIQGVAKLRTYRTFKSTPKCEEYVCLDLKKYERSLLSHLRFGILPLRIETGRYVGEPVEQRLCRFCALNAVEDERHFLLECELYNQIRIDTIGEITAGTDYDNMTPEQRLSYMLNSFPRKCATFIAKSYLYRRSCMYNH